MLQIGSVVDNKYKILNKIGQGGMSTVYLAMNERANKQWAIKEIRKDKMEQSQVAIDSLRTEPELLMKLSHPHLPSIADLIDYDDSFLVVMDYIEGNTLSRALIDYGPQPQEYVIEWAKQMCDVLGYLHSQEYPIIYRDLKPSNIMLKPDGNIVLIDFGTARRYKHGNIEDTTCLGTRGYAAPEQFGGQGQTDARTDIYCLGATMYHLVTGKNPSDPPYEMYPIRYWNDNLSQGLEKIILKCTQLDPAQRYQNCAQLLYDLEHYFELDNAYIKKEKIKLASFSITAALAIICAAASITFFNFAGKVQASSYEKIMDEADKSFTQQEMGNNYQDAIAVNPRKADAYIDLINKVYLEDDNFTEEEALELRQLLITTRNGKRYEDYLAEDIEGYSLFAYRLGLAYFYCYEVDGNKPQSAYWFQKAADGLLDASQKERAIRLGSIAEYYISIGSEDKSGDDKVSYRQYWDDLKSVSQGNITAIDNATTALVIYREMTSQICINANEFKAAGITYQEISAEIEAIQSHIEKDIRGTQSEQSQRVKELENDVEDNIVKANQILQMAY